MTTGADQAATVELLAVKTWPAVGAVAADTATEVVALLSAVATGSAQDAAVALLAVRTRPAVGAAAAETSTVVVALLSETAGGKN